MSSEISLILSDLNKEIQTSHIHDVLIREYTVSYSKHLQSCIYQYSLWIRENTVLKMPVFIIVLCSKQVEKKVM